MSTQNDHQTVRHWKSLEEWQNDPKVQQLAENEFMSSPLSEEGDSPSARRTFLKLMGASLALSTTACLRRPVQKIIPYVNRPKEIIPGVANYYTSVLKDQGEGFGIVVKTREGRPIKIEGNPSFPTNGPGLTARAHAYVLSLYDPDRLREPKKNIQNDERSNRDTIAAGWSEVDSKMKSQLAKGGVAVLTPTLASPSSDKLIGEFVKNFNGQHVVWDAAGADDILNANEKAYGEAIVPHYRFDKANMILSLGADFLGTWISPAEFSRQFASRRNPDSAMNKLVVFESNMSLTGQNADERTPVAPSELGKIALIMAQRLIKSHKATTDKAVISEIDRLAAGISGLSVTNKVIFDLADNLWKNRGNSLVVAGEAGESESLQVVVNLLNSLLKNDGVTVRYKNPQMTLAGRRSNIEKLIDDMNAGKVKTLIMHKANPIYALPESVGFRSALNKVEFVVYAGSVNESALTSDYMVPAHHDFENWGDAEFVKGVFAIQQPTISPMYNSRAFEDMLLGWQKDAGKSAESSWYDYLRKNWKASVLKGGSFDAKWDQALQTGVVGQLNDSVESGRRFKASALADVKKAKASDDLEIVFYQKSAIGDGAMANMAWMQELPDPVTKIVWDNYINVAPSTAKAKGLSEGDVLEVSVAGEKLKLPVHIQAGVNTKTLAIALGYGQKGLGKVAEGVGGNAFKLTAAGFAGQAVTFKKTLEKEVIANTQGHHTMFGRHLAYETTHGEYEKNKKAGHHKPHFTGEMWPPHKYPKHKWGMTIDVNACTGCSSCVVACQAENNIPVVGKKYVLRGREMHWLRIDRYYSEHPDNPETIHQPLPCQHCDNAPCETVCPVIATTHSDEGINEMTYNRCVGTRYCANNCPFKVRRFNWFDYEKYREPQEMVLNPEVQVRSRGVMEKCSFCVQRIKEAKNVARDENRDLKDGEIKVACEQSCPTQAIVFGDTNDPNSRVSKLIAQKRSYTMLQDLNVKPAVHYQTKVRNRAVRADDHQGGHH